MTSASREAVLGAMGFLGLLEAMDWRMEPVFREVAAIAWHFHWSRAECMAMSRREREAWIGEIRRILKEARRGAR